MNIRVNINQNTEKHKLLRNLPKTSPEGVEAIKGHLNSKAAESWSGAVAVPPGTLLDCIVELFRRETDIALELPMITVLSYISGFLNAKSVKWKMPGNSLHAPKLWTVVLADSGAGKTFTTDTISRWLKDPKTNQSPVPMFENANSAAKFVESLEETPKGLYIRDEFGQFLKQIQTMNHMEEIKDILLQMFSGQIVSRITMKRKIVISDHALSILGVTVGDTFESQIGADSLVDGFAQRFNYINAKEDKTRNFIDFPFYFENIQNPENTKIFRDMTNEWTNILERKELEGEIFEFKKEAFEEFKDQFRQLFHNEDIPKSFYRRVMFSAFNYAVIYHILLNHSGSKIGKIPMGWAMRMIKLHLYSARQLLNSYGLSQLEQTIRKAERVKINFPDLENNKLLRKLISNVAEIKNVNEAKAIIPLLSTSK